jgi:hypothetical protein
VEHAPTDPGQLPPQPAVPSNPVETGLPATSASIIFSGALLDYVPIAVFCNASSCGWTVNEISSPVVGLINPQGGQQSSGSFSANWNQLMYTEMIDPASTVAQGSTVLETDYWQLQFQDIVPPNQPYTITHQLTSGVSQTDTTSFSYTVGISVGGSYADITADMSASLTKSFEHSVTVTTEETDTREIPVTVQSYTQIVGLYQLMQTFAVVPAANLQQYISQQNGYWGTLCQDMHVFCSKYSTGANVVNPLQTYLWVVAHDTSSTGAKPMLSAREALELAKSSITVEGVV